MSNRSYQLPPIPVDRGFALLSSPSSSSSMADSSPLASTSRAAQLVADVDEPMASPTKASSASSSATATTGSAGSSLLIPSAQAERKRPSVLSKLRLPGTLGGYPRDPDGTSAVAPPTPLVNQQLLLPQPASPGPSAPTFTGLDSKRASVPSRFQPKKVMQGKGFPSVLSGKGEAAAAAASSSSSRPGRLQKQQQRLSKQGFPFPEMHFTPPPTPHKGGLPQTIVTEPIPVPGAAHLPPTPPSGGSPLPSPRSPSIPQTVSAQALWHHAVHPLFLAHYELGDELGSGGFGFVVQARRRSDGMVCAVKFIYKEKVPERAWVKDEYWGDEDDANGVLRTRDGIKRVPLEAYVLKTIRHRGVVAFVDLFEDKKYIYLIMEHHGSPWQAPPKSSSAPGSVSPVASLAPTVPSSSPLSKTGSRGTLPLSRSGSSMLSDSPLSASPSSTTFPLRPGALSPMLDVPPVAPPMMRRSSCDLFECIEQHSRLPESHAKYVFAQLIDVVGCLHYNGFVHRDIKDENVVIDDTFRVKLIDFGSTHLFDFRRGARKLNQFFGTMNFASPEILRESAYQPMAAEVWSLGILLSILVTGESFFRNPDAIRSYRASPPAVHLSSACLDIIWRCLAEDPKDRWSCFKLRHHPWLADCQWEFSTLPSDAVLDSIESVRRH